MSELRHRQDTTEPGHVAFAHLAVNPLDKALQLRDAIYKLGEERARRVHHPGKYHTDNSARLSQAGNKDLTMILIQ